MDFDVFYSENFVSIALVAGVTAGHRARGEEIAQEAFASAAQRWSELLAYDRPGAWVRRVAINLALTSRRRDRHEARALRRLGPVADDQPEPRAGDPRVWAAVDALPPRRRAITYLFYFEDRSVAEVADLLGLSVSAVTSHLHNARTALSAVLGDLKDAR